MKVGIFIINLRDGNLRRNHIITQMNNVGINDYTFIEAVDGRKKKSYTFKEYDNYTIIKTGKVLSSTEVGCFLSHLKAIVTGYINNFDYAVILEDDVYLTKEFKEFIDNIDYYMDGYNLLRLLNYKKKYNPNKPIKFNLRSTLRNWGGAHGYAIDSKSMSYITNKFNGKEKFIKRKFDNFMWTYQMPLIVGDTQNSFVQIKNDIKSDIGYNVKLKKFLPSRILFDIYNNIRLIVFKILVFPVLKIYFSLKEMFI